MSDSLNQDGLLKFKIILSWQICLFSLLFLPLLIYLGFWQLERADQKRTIQQLVERQQSLAPQLIEKLIADVEEGGTVLYRRAKSQGHFDLSHYWLIENRSHKGRNGFHVVAPFYLDSGQTVLVNRGWVLGSAYRDKLPVVDVPKGSMSIVGQLTVPSVNKLLEGEVKVMDGWPRVILQLNLQTMAKELGRPILPWVLQIAPEDLSALQANWSVINVPVSKHLGYAYQWFAMAFALLILTVLANTNLPQILRKK